MLIFVVGTYHWSVEDSNGCSRFGSVDVNQPEGIIFEINDLNYKLYFYNTNLDK